MSFQKSPRRLLALAAAALCFATVAPSLLAHCQIPCGIFEDEMRFDHLREHVTTIEKSMKQIEEIGKADKPDWNQLVRWVNNKDDHAAQLNEIVTYYFLAQRITPEAHGDDVKLKAYHAKLEVLHHIMFHAMKAKQTTDMEHVTKLRELITKFEKAYMGEHGDHSH